MKKYLLITLALAVFACDKPSSDGTKERARSESEANSEIAQKTQADKAAKMEIELRARHAFYQAIAGSYEGTIETAAGAYNMRAIFVPTLPPYLGERVRELSEIESDLKNLYFNVQVLQWAKGANAKTAYGCRFASILPDMSAGTIGIASDQCSLVYRMALSEPSRNGALKDLVAAAPEVARALREKSLTAITRLVGTAQASTVPAPYTFDLRKVEL